MTGDRYGRLVEVQPEGRGRASYTCDCGTTFIAYTSNVRGGRTRSCGCLKRERLALRNRERFTTHGHSRRPTPEYRTWTQMIQRCTNPRATNFGKYGGRGITVCDAWRNFAVFYADMGRRPPGRTLDRIDGTRGYEPDNCRWATPLEQRHNRCR